MTILWAHLILVLSTVVVVDVNGECEVLVHEPWPTPYLLVPQNSTVFINCTATTSSFTPIWSIHPGNDSSSSQLQFSTKHEELNDLGFYELRPINESEMFILRLEINDTTMNNQTKILCDSEGSETLIVYEPTPLSLNVSMTSLNSLNISWSQIDQSENTSHTILLSINSSSQTRILSLNNSESHYILSVSEKTATDSQFQCEVYNFSVTAIPVGATYTGDGCSVPSEVQSIMLPSLWIENVSILLFLTTEGLSMNISFESYACDSEEYPTQNYTMKLEDQCTNEISSIMHFNHSISDTEQSFVIERVLENMKCSLQIIATNEVGNIVPITINFTTTDVQVVTVTINKKNALLHCKFITGSNARGCLVVLGSAQEVELETHNVTKLANRNEATAMVTLNHPPPCYGSVKAYDIESDSSIGNLSVPGTFDSEKGNENTTCSITDDSRETLIIAAVIVTFVVVAVVICVFLPILIIINIYKHKRRGTISIANDEVQLALPTPVYEEVPQLNEYSTQSDSEVHHDSSREHRHSPEYDRPNIVNQVESDDLTSADGYSKTRHHPVNISVRRSHDRDPESPLVSETTVTYSKLLSEEHQYHTLERDREPKGIHVNTASTLDDQSINMPDSENANTIPLTRDIEPG